MTLTAQPKTTRRPIADSYRGKHLLLTGATGFLGKVLLSSLLKRCPDIGKITIIIRANSQQALQDRFIKDIVTSPTMDPLRDIHGSGLHAWLEERVKVVRGDLGEKDAGLEKADLDALVKDLDLVVHCAGLVDFVPPLDDAISVNIDGTLTVLELAKKAGKGKVAFLHVSTCFVCGLKPGQHAEDLDLKDYPNRKHTNFDGFDADVEVQHARRIVERIQREENQDPLVQAATWEEAEGSPRKAKRFADARVRRRLVEAGVERAQAWGWPNTYTYSKALAERLVLKAAPDLGPTTIVRPAVVESAVRYPFQGWNQGVNTSAPLVWLTARGQRHWPTTDDFFLDVIPVDMVVHAIVMIGAQALDARQQPALLEKVYQLGTSDVNPFAMRRVVELASLVYSRKPDAADGMIGAFLRRNLEAIAVPVPVYTRYGLPAQKRLATGLRSLLDRVPMPENRPRLASLLDAVKSKVKDSSRDLEKAEQIIQIYMPFIATCPVSFRCDRARRLYSELTPEDQAALPYDPEKLDWRFYWTEVHIPGLERWSFPQLRLQSGTGPTEYEPVFKTLTDLVEDRSRYGRLVCWRRIDQKGEVVTRVTYEEVVSRSKAAAARLVKDGVRPGDRVMLLSENCPEWGLGYFGALFAGATAVPLEPGTDAARVVSLLKASKAKVCLVSAQTRAAGARDLEARVAAEGLACRVRSLEEAVAAAARGEELPKIPHEADLVPRAPASLIYTSGTTGSSKGVLLSHEAFCRQVRAIASLFTLGGEDRVLSVLPLHHGFEFSAGFLSPLYGGATVTYLHETTPEAVRAALDVVRPTCMIGVPALFDAWQRKIRRQVRAKGANAERAYEALLTVHRQVRERTKLNLGRKLFPEIHAAFGGGLRFVVSGGAALARDVALEFQGIGLDIYEGYGMTEAGPVITTNRPGEEIVVGSVGTPIPEAEVRIKDQDGEGVGEILARSPCLFTAYDGDPELTARTLVDGWLHTGDLGRLDEQGYLHIVGRLKDAIVDGAGNTVHPDEVEDLYAACPDVAELAVAGVSLKGDHHEVVGALVVPRQDVEGGSDAARERIREYVRVASESIPYPKRIKLLQFTTRSLPRTPTRKVKRAEVGRMLAEMSRVGEPAGSRRQTRRVGALAEVARIFEEVAGVDPTKVVPEANLSQDLGLDSIGLAEVALALAETYARPAPTSLGNVTTVAELLALFDQDARRATSVVVEPAASDVARAIDLPAPVQRGVSGALDVLHDAAFEHLLDVVVRGRGNIPHHTNCIVVANHASHLDVGLVKHSLGDYGKGLVSAGARDYFFKDTLRATYFENFTNVVPFDRHASVRDSLQRFVELLRQGKTILIFPEGTRSVTGRMASFKPGLGLLVQASRTGVLPIYLGGTYSAMPKGTLLPRRRPLEARIGRFMPADKLLAATEKTGRRQQAQRIVDLVRGSLVSLRDGRPFDLDREAGHVPVSERAPDARETVIVDMAPAPAPHGHAPQAHAPATASEEVAHAAPAAVASPAAPGAPGEVVPPSAPTTGRTRRARPAGNGNGAEGEARPRRTRRTAKADDEE